MKREEKIRKPEDRSPKSEAGSRKMEAGDQMSEAATLMVIGREKKTAICNFSTLPLAVEAVEFIQLKQAGSKRKENVEYRTTNIESGSGASARVSHFLFLISYSLFPALWLKPENDNNFSIRQLFKRNSTVHNYKQFSFNPLRQPADTDSGAPCRQIRFAGYFLSINFLTMRELKQVLTKKIFLHLLPGTKTPIIGETLNPLVGGRGAFYCL